MKCTKCQADTNLTGDLHCRKTFNEEFERLLLENNLESAKTLYESVDFDHTWMEEKKFKKRLQDKLTDKRELEDKLKTDQIITKSKNHGLSDREIMYLEKREKYEHLAVYYLNLYKRTKDMWALSKASSSYRDNNTPNRSIAITDKLDRTGSDRQALSAVITSRGAAFKDLKIMDQAILCAHEAIEINETHYPYFLLGSIYLSMGDSDMATKFFRKAELLGENPERIRKEILKYSKNK